MFKSHYHLLVVSSHVVQYSPVRYREMAAHPQLDVEVCFCTMQGAEIGVDPEFGVEVAWDVPLLEGYSWKHLTNRSLWPDLGKFWGIVNPDLWAVIRDGRFDAVFVSGYSYASAWIAILAAKRYGVKVFLSTDAHGLPSRRAHARASLWFKKLLVREIFRLADIAMGCSQGSVAYLQSLGIPQERIVLAPFVVDNGWWIQQADAVDRDAVRKDWGIAPAARVLLFCAKLQPWKRPQDAMDAFALANLPNSYLVFAGDGPLRQQLEDRARDMGLKDKVRWLGLVNQSALPGVYRASDLLLLPSDHEPFGLVVNEAMLCGCPVVISDRVGAKFDLTSNQETGYVYPCGDVAALASIIRQIFSDGEAYARMRDQARQRLETWSPREYAAAVVEAIERAMRQDSVRVNARRDSGERLVP
jgi:glycosyltransferase involved in cell wall biosynthesis